MTHKPQAWSLDSLNNEAQIPIAVVASPSVSPTTQALLHFPHYDSLQNVPKETKTLVVVGGGSLIDAAKLYKREFLPHSHLVAIPSLWGSGAEVSPVAVATENEEKVFTMDDALIPDAHIVLPQLAESIPDKLAHYGSGDAWSHVLEGALSPLSNDDLRKQGAQIIKEMLQTGLNKDSAWFGLSARACRIQASSSVGLIHGIAHALEPTLQKNHPNDGWGHAKLCAILILPVMRLCQKSSSKWTDFAKENAINTDEAEAAWKDLFDAQAFQQLLPALKSNWVSVLRNPLTRTNHALVRRKDLDFFLEGDFK